MNRASGVTLIELMGVLGLTGIALGIAALSLQPMEAPLDSGAKLMEGFFRQARAKAIATTSAYRVTPQSSTDVMAEFASSCSDTTWTADQRLQIELRDDVSLVDTSWSVCFSSRGVSGSNTVVDLWHADNGIAEVEVLLGGLSRVLP